MPQPTFWCLRSTESTRRLAEWAHDEMDMETVICPTNEGHQRAGKRLTNLSVTLPGHTVEDVVWTWYGECLLTDRTLELFQSSRFTGFEVKPVKTSFKQSSVSPPTLWELVVTGWGGMAPPESGIKLLEHCPDCGATVYSDWSEADKLVEPSQWDGSDFFIVWPLPGFIFVTDRVAQAVRSNQLGGTVLTAQSDLRVSSGVIPGLSPGRLSYYMPEKRAKELGEPLGIY